MKKFLALIFLSTTLLASVPTEEGLLKNVSNADLPGKFVTIKMMVQPIGSPGMPTEKGEYVKLLMSLENPGQVDFLQINYVSGQMLNSQAKSAKHYSNLLQQIRREVAPEKSLFYGVLMMLATNQSEGMEAFLEKNGVKIVKNKMILNEDKMKLLRAYRTYLATHKGRGDEGSPLNPDDPKQKESALDLFRSNTFRRASNISLMKNENEFMWKVDWKNIQAFFSNEERQFRELTYAMGDAQVKLEASDYLLFNGINELPKFMNFKDSKGQLFKIQILGQEVKKKSDKSLAEIIKEVKEGPLLEKPESVVYPFLF